MLSPYDPASQNLSEDLRGPRLEHPLGQDKLGRDQLSRLIYGTRVSLAVGLSTVAVTVTLGVLFGALAGYARAVELTPPLSAAHYQLALLLSGRQTLPLD